MKQKLLNFVIHRGSVLSAALLFVVFFSFLGINQPGGDAVKPQVLGEISPVLVRGEQAIQAPPPVPVKTGEIDTGSISAQSFLAYDEQSGAVLAQKDPSSTLGIASLTKLLTALVVYENLDLSSYVTISTKDILNVSPSLGLRVSDKVKVDDLFNAMLIGSCNDAALTLANHTAAATGTTFESLMNKKAESIGMKNSHFSNPMGFDSIGNFSTAQDVKFLVDETKKLEVFTLDGRQTSYAFVSETGISYRAVATNKLIAKDQEISAIKTGYTNQTGGSMIVQATHEGHSVVIIILGSKDREADTVKLKAEIFNNFTWKETNAQ